MNGPAMLERSYDQRLEALRRANDIRSYRKDLKAALADGGRVVADVLERPEPEVMTMHIVRLLLATPRWGRVKANRALARAKISPSRTVGSLTERQRRELATYVRARGVQPRTATLPTRDREREIGQT